MKKIVLIIIAVLVSFIYVSAQDPIDTRPKLQYLMSSSAGYPNTTSQSWIKDTLALRAMLDSNGYTGSCLPFIYNFVSDKNSLSDPMGLSSYRINELRFTNTTWLKKVTSNVSSMLYLKTINIYDCTNLTNMTGLSQYVQNISIYNSPIATFNFGFTYIKILALSSCKNLKTFSYTLPNIKGLGFLECGLIDLTGLTVGDSLKNYRINLDNNNLTTLPLTFLQKLVTNKDSISVTGNCLLNAPANITAILDKIAIGGVNWRTTQKVCVGVKTINKQIVIKSYKSINTTRVDLNGRLIKKGTPSAPAIKAQAGKIFLDESGQK